MTAAEAKRERRRERFVPVEEAIESLEGDWRGIAIWKDATGFSGCVLWAEGLSALVTSPGYVYGKATAEEVVRELIEYSKRKECAEQGGKRS